MSNKALARKNARRNIRGLAASMSGLGVITTKDIFPSRSNRKRILRTAQALQKAHYDKAGVVGRGMTDSTIYID